MSEPRFSDLELSAYLDEDLSPDLMRQIEDALRTNETTLIERLAHINRRRDSGLHALGEIWRRHRISCPPREQLGSFLLGVLPSDEVDYLQFHLQELGCRLCQANLEDLQQQRSAQDPARETRRRKYFQTSASYLDQDH